jgi:hypothetical protein
LARKLGSPCKEAGVQEHLGGVRGSGKPW